MDYLGSIASQTNRVARFTEVETSGVATVPFASFLSEGTVSITGQTRLLSTSSIKANVYADNDDVYAQDWNPIIIRNVVAGTGFDIVLRPDIGQFSGNVKVNWSWD